MTSKSMTVGSSSAAVTAAAVGTLNTNGLM
jgi:hypothetical protein